MTEAKHFLVDAQENDRERKQVIGSLDLVTGGERYGEIATIESLLRSGRRKAMRKIPDLKEIEKSVNADVRSNPQIQHEVFAR